MGGEGGREEREIECGLEVSYIQQLTSIIHQHIRATAALVLYVLETSLNLAGVRKVSSMVFNKLGSKFLAVL